MEALTLTAELRAAGVKADRSYENRSMKSQMKVADRSGAAFAVIIGTNELEAGTAVVRPLRAERTEGSGQSTVPRPDLIEYLKKAIP